LYEWGSYVKTNALDVSTSRTTPEEGAHSPSWPNGLIIIIITIIIIIIIIIDSARIISPY
jgi:hypothetical protein